MTQAAPFEIHALELGPMENFVYLIEDKSSGRAAVVDPAWDVPSVLKLARQRGVKITDILLTHSHNDHINGIDDVLIAFDAQLHLLNAEAKFWSANLSTPSLHHGGDEIKLGDTRIEVMHTPGHTPGSACYKIDNQLITGDTLFVFGCGRCDLAGGDPEEMFSTLKDMRKNLPQDTVILPGHNYSETPTSTMQEQIDGNPFMHFDETERFVEYRMYYHDKHRHGPYGPICKGHEMPQG
jgi:glyoxylase-like metal-dependent hydrolase (beta-lactamase superfamily II)